MSASTVAHYKKVLGQFLHDVELEDPLADGTVPLEARATALFEQNLDGMLMSHVEIEPGGFFITRSVVALDLPAQGKNRGLLVGIYEELVEYGRRGHLTGYLYESPEIHGDEPERYFGRYAVAAQRHILEESSRRLGQLAQLFPNQKADITDVMLELIAAYKAGKLDADAEPIKGDWLELL